MSPFFPSQCTLVDYGKFVTQGKQYIYGVKETIYLWSTKYSFDVRTAFLLKRDLPFMDDLSLNRFTVTTLLVILQLET